MTRKTDHVHWISFRKAWPKTWMFGGSICWGSGVCVMFHLGPCVLMIGPHFLEVSDDNDG